MTTEAPFACSSPAGRRLGALLLIFFLTISAGCASILTAPEPSPPVAGRRIDLNGPWKVHPTRLTPADRFSPAVDDSGWPQIQVPGHWDREGLAGETSLWYRRRFPLAGDLAGYRLRLVFDRVNYAADVWVNGTYLGHQARFPAPFEFDVTGLLKAGDNLLAVRVESPPDSRDLIRGGITETGQHPPRNPGGITGPVHLRISEAVAIETLRVTPETVSDGGGRCEVALTLASGLDEETGLTFRATLTPLGERAGSGGRAVVDRTVTVPPGRSTTSLMLAADRVRRWWPWDAGDAPLYRVAVTVLREGRPLDTAGTTIGFRRLQWNPRTAEFRINGRRIFLRGTIYAGSRWPAGMTEADYRRDVELMKGANINTVRVSGHPPRPVFYRICDAEGLLVWQDPAINGGSPADRDFQKKAVRQSRAMVETLRDHPAIIAWAAGIEGPSPGGIISDKQALHAAVADALTEADGSRYVHRPDPGTRPGWGWFSDTYLRYADADPPHLITAFGAPALPDDGGSPAGRWPAEGPDWDQLEARGLTRREAVEVAGIVAGSGPDELARRTRRYSARLIGFAAERLRLARFNPVAGIFQYGFVPPSPMTAWGIVDASRRPLPGYAALKTAYQPVMPIIEWDRTIWTAGETVTVTLWTVNDRPDRFDGARLDYAVITAEEGAAVLSRSTELTIWPDAARKALALRLDGLAEGAYRLMVTLTDADGRPLGENGFDFEVVF